MEGRNVVVIRHPRRVAGARIATGLDEEDARPRLDQTRGEPGALAQLFLAVEKRRSS